MSLLFTLLERGFRSTVRRVQYTPGRHYHESIQELLAFAYQLATHPELVPAYQLRLYPLSLERSALLASLQHEEQHALECVQTAYEEERERVEDEWKRGRERIKERLLEGSEERRRRAREDKEGEGTAAGELPAYMHLLHPPLTQEHT